MDESGNATVQALEERVRLLTKGLNSAIGYMDAIATKKWVKRPDGLIHELTAILGEDGKDGG